MNREEAIKQLEVYRACMMVDGAETDAYDIAIEALEQQPCDVSKLTQKAYEDGKKDGYVQAKAEQQPCEDAISRRAAIDALPRFKFIGENAYRNAVAVIENLPAVSTEKMGRWIPCTERLPEVNQRVLVTSYGRVCYAMMISADGNSGYPVFRLQDSLNEKVVCETTVHSEFTTSRIIAWMPLPQPYKAESEDKE